MAGYGDKCKDLHFMGLCNSVKENLTGTGKPTEQTLRKYAPERKLHTEGFFLSFLYFFPHFTNKVPYSVMDKMDVLCITILAIYSP